MISKSLSIIVLAIVFSIPALAQQVNHTNLDTYKWENRLLLVFSSSNASADYRLQMSNLRREEVGLQDRDLKVFSLTDDGNASVDRESIPREEVQRLADKYNADFGVFMVILIGKDGSEKLRQNNPLKSEKLFSVIDEMPMRQQEMNR